MAAAFNDGESENEFIQSLRKAIKGNKANYICASASGNNKPGSASGKLIGGNLALLAHVIGTPSDFDTKNCILFIEDIGEYLYNIDRMLYQLKRSGKLDKHNGAYIWWLYRYERYGKAFGKSIDEHSCMISVQTWISRYALISR